MSTFRYIRASLTNDIALTKNESKKAQEVHDNTEEFDVNEHHHAFKSLTKSILKG